MSRFHWATLLLAQDPGSDLRHKSHTSMLLMTVVFAAQAAEPETQPHHNRNTLLLDKLRSINKECWGGKHSTGNTHPHTPSFCVVLLAVGNHVASAEKQLMPSCSLASRTRKSIWEFSTDSTEENLSEFTQGFHLPMHSSNAEACVSTSSFSNPG